MPLSSSTRDRFALEEVEKIMGVALVGYGPAGGAVVVSGLPCAGPRRVSADDLETLASFRDPEAPGWTRRVFSSFDRAGREWVAGRMEEAGLAVETDAAAQPHRETARCSWACPARS